MPCRRAPTNSATHSAAIRTIRVLAFLHKPCPVMRHTAPQRLIADVRPCRRNWLKSLRSRPKEIKIPFLPIRAVLAAITPDPVDEFVRGTMLRGSRGDLHAGGIARFVQRCFLCASSLRCCGCGFRGSARPHTGIRAAAGSARRRRSSSAGSIISAHPEPDKVPLAVRGMSRLGQLTDTEGAGVYVGFLAGISRANPDRADMLIAKMFPLDDEHQWAIVRAIAYSGLPDWRTLMQRIAERMPARRVMIERYLSGKLPTLDQAPIEKDETLGEKIRAQMLFVNYFSKPKREFGLDLLTPDVLDTLWGYFYATGDYRPLQRIVLMLRWTKERDVLEKLTLGSMAKYTLAINSARNADLLATLKWAETQPQPEHRQAGAQGDHRGGRNGRDRQDAQRGARRDRRAQAQGAGLEARPLGLGTGRGGGAGGRLHRARRHRPGRIRHPLCDRRGCDFGRVAAVDTPK